MNLYIGSENQLYGVEEHRLVGGRGDGMRLLEVRGGAGLSFTISLDRCADISRLSFDGVNFGFFTDCGYVAPQYFDPKGAGFLKSFTAGFLTTCGLSSVGEPCVDGGEEVGLHGTVSHIPAEHFSYEVNEEKIRITAVMRDVSALEKNLVFKREYLLEPFGDTLTITDRVENHGPSAQPYQILYHFNIGYPLLSEKAVLSIPALETKPRCDHAKTGLDRWSQVEKPQKGYQEMCFYHTMAKDARVALENPAIGLGLEMTYDAEKLPCFTQWKMMGERDYVMGLEPGNAYPDGRDVMRKEGRLVFLSPGEATEHSIKFRFFRKK
ncbi:MAG: aldose 1-epimerase family protein [Clostridia bacterium]|nr:aldose 1-epimerase family protein [Clostridia bacterium]